MMIEVNYTKCWTGRTRGKRYFLTVERVALDTVGSDGINKTGTLTVFEKNGALVSRVHVREYWHGTSDRHIKTDLLCIAGYSG